MLGVSLVIPIIVTMTFAQNNLQLLVFPRLKLSEAQS
jgi:hypothetical protein